MLIRLVVPADRAEWLRMRLKLWGGTAAEHIQDIDTYFSSPQEGVTFVVERSAGGLCGFIEVSLCNYAEGCTTSPVAYIADRAECASCFPLPRPRCSHHRVTPAQDRAARPR